MYRWYTGLAGLDPCARWAHSPEGDTSGPSPSYEHEASTILGRQGLGYRLFGFACHGKGLLVISGNVHDFQGAWLAVLPCIHGHGETV